MGYNSKDEDFAKNIILVEGKNSCTSLIKNTFYKNNLCPKKN
jgi:hypothetical protein